MSLGERLRGLFGRGGSPRAGKVRVQVLIRGRIGEGWHDVDRTLQMPAGSRLSDLFTEAERQGVPLREAIESSPHLRETMMWNGERAPVEESLHREIEDGDEIYLLAPVAGGSLAPSRLC